MSPYSLLYILLARTRSVRRPPTPTRWKVDLIKVAWSRWVLVAPDLSIWIIFKEAYVLQLTTWFYFSEWLLAEETWRTSIRVHWWCANVGRTKVLLEAPPPPAPLALRPCARDLALLRAACPVYSFTKALLALENATSHRQVSEALNVLERYVIQVLHETF